MPDLLSIPRRGGEETRVSLSSFKGKEYLDLRVYYQAEGGTMRPTPKGVTVPLWALPALAEAVKVAQRKTGGPTTATIESLAAHRARMDAEDRSAVIDPEGAA